LGKKGFTSGLQCSNILITEDEMKEAKFIKKLKDYRGDARLYKVNEPVEFDRDYVLEKFIKKTSYIIVSATNVMFNGPETYIFPADKKGNVISWTELEGSRKGTLSHNKVLTEIGYSII